jgi:uncharacterized protein YndB with AHSA1/START domain
VNSWDSTLVSHVFLVRHELDPCQINACRASVYRALLDARAIAKWKVPDGMTCHVHAFDAREGGSFRISLAYDAPSGTAVTE